MSRRISKAQALLIAAWLVIGIPALGVTFSSRGFAQDRRADGRLANPGLPGWCETPVAERKAEAGCYTTAITALGELPQAPLFWYLDAYPTRDAAEASRGPRATVVESHKKFWVFTIAEQGWRAPAGKRVAGVGPLVTVPGTAYTARYMETVIGSGVQKDGMGHRHPGPEAWYVLEGGQCLETPAGVMTARAGQTMIAPEGAPMAISSLGPDTRRAIVLILHRSDEPYSMPVGARPELPHSHWKPQGLCAAQAATAPYGP